MEETRTLPERVHLWSDHWAAQKVKAEAFRRLICRNGAPHHLAKYNRGVYELAVDVLDDPELTAGMPGVSPDRRSSYQATEQQLAFMMTAFDQELSAAETGRLIRMVLHAEQGALFALAVAPRNYVLGIAFGTAASRHSERSRSLPRIPLVRDADIFTSELATLLRDQMGLPPQNLGGWRTPAPTAQGQGREELIPGMTHLPVIHRWGPENTVAKRLSGALNPAELIYLARVGNGHVVEEVDLFDHAEVVAARPPGEPPETARAYYRRLAEECGMYARQLGQIARQAVRGRLLRVVLDVEQGAIYYYRLSSAEFLVGLTLNQKRVSEADEKLGDLVAELYGKDRSTP
jgi:hypothetical protein